ncbi:hypothetical protein LQG66_18055 [Bradyrhizobium ontarionense]|uniref:Uncharacterized protein n=1 Tax=Bradyrhizobium ontarionense TaxID=2898149 RepID=A0ABY3RLC2_9BRAD|nr:hypothetical protein [Bradyrhizobium sp. A19]UFZ08074.1 hypothetical protein LQG66_18055 [Bradyrhizobium sp. A19]
MSGILLGIDDRLWLMLSLVLTVAFHFLNRTPRLSVDRAVAPLRVPERTRGYSADQLIAFRLRALDTDTKARQTALSIYRDKVLRIDIGFAVALGLFSALLWHWITPYLPSQPFLTGVSWIGWSASFLYLIFDVAEDIALIQLLSPDRAIGTGEASIASTFTVGKLVFIIGSLFGLVVFLVLAATDWMIERSS